jgi:hypothetical protein
MRRKRIPTDVLEFLRRLAEPDSGFVIGNPRAPHLRPGMPNVGSIRHKSGGHYIDKIASRWRAHAMETARCLPGSLRTGDNNLDSIFDESQQCWLMGCHGAAITLAAIAVEHAIKKAVHLKRIGGYSKFNTERWDRGFDNRDFRPAIQDALKEGLISDHEKKRLDDFTARIRNPYTHYNLQRLVAGLVLSGIETIDLKSGSRRQTDVDVGKEPCLQAFAKRLVDRDSVAAVVLFSAHVVKSVFARLEHYLDANGLN